MSQFKSLAVVLLLLIKLNLYIKELASGLDHHAHNHARFLHYDDKKHRAHTNNKRSTNGPAGSYSFDSDIGTTAAAMRILSRTSSLPLEDKLAVISGGDSSNLLVARDNKIDDLFYDQQAPTAPTITTRQCSGNSDEEKSSSGSDAIKHHSALPLYNTINLENSIEEPEMFTNNHQSSSVYMPEASQTSAASSSISPQVAAAAAGSISGYIPRHYHQQQPGPAKNSHHSGQAHSEGNYLYQSHNYLPGKHHYQPNMFANNYNLNYIHSLLSSKPTPPQLSTGQLLNIPADLLNSNPNRLTLGIYGNAGFASSHISASSALSAAVNNLQLSIGQKQQQQQGQGQGQGQLMSNNQYSSGLADKVPLSSQPQPQLDPHQPEPSSGQTVNARIGDLPGSSICGRQQVAAYREPRVVGGNNTYEGEFPWAVSIQRHGNHHCGGVIVGKRWILTAAHCVRSQLVSNLIVRTGGHTLTKSANSLNGHMEKDYQVEQIVMHDDFSRYDNLTISQLKSSANTNNADIALLKLKHEILWSELAWPVCFPNREAGNFSGHDATVIGWGKLNEKSEEFSNELQKVKLTIIDNKVCQNWFRQAGRDMPIDDRIICAGFKSGGKDACHGDSGGPLLSRINGQYVVVGVVSTGIGCARPLLPGLYSRVSSYINWIERYITS